MLEKILLPTILRVLAYGFWASPNFKTISAGIAINLIRAAAADKNLAEAARDVELDVIDLDRIGEHAEENTPSE